jgi:hypothetical protein
VLHVYRRSSGDVLRVPPFIPHIRTDVVHACLSRDFILSLLPCMRSASKKMRGMWKGKLSVTPYADERSGIYI